MTHKLNMNKLGAAQLRAKNAEPVATLRSMDAVNNNIARVVATFDKVPSDKQSATIALASVLGDKVVPVADSFMEVQTAANSRDKVTVAGFVALKPEVRVIDKEVQQEEETEVTSQYREIATNLLMDDVDKSSWTVSECDNKKILTRNYEEDISELISIASVSPIKSSMAEMFTVAHVEAASTYSNQGELERVANLDNAEYLSVLCTETASVHTGYRVGENTAYIPSTDKTINFDVKDVVAIVAMNGQDELSAVAKPDEVNVETATAYFKELVLSNSSFYEELDDSIHACAKV